MNYADKEYYRNEYNGKLSDERFKSLINKASRIIDNNINRELDEEKFKKLDERVQEKVKYTVCALSDLLGKREDTNKNVSSISIDGVSKTYKTMTEAEFNEEKKEILSFLPIELTRLW